MTSNCCNQPIVSDSDICSKCGEHCEELEVEVYTDDQKFWLEIKESAELDIQKLEKLLKFQKEIVLLCNDKL